jgi:methylated-DNA-[protein]-cysteine S-methyltransferase
MQLATITTPAGPLTILATDAGTVRAAAFTDDPGQLRVPVPPDLRPRRDLGEITATVRAYLDGDLTAIDRVAVSQPPGGAFLDRVWDVLRQTKPGAPVSYTQLATLAGRPAAVRAAASACARNHAALFVPCHRVLRADGSLGGYRWGPAVKQWLLRHEGR